MKEKVNEIKINKLITKAKKEKTLPGYTLEIIKMRLNRETKEQKIDRITNRGILESLAQEKVV